jgi:carbon-monoxide dehydrogenase large subunit
VRGYAERGVSLAEVARNSSEDLLAEAEFSPEHGSVWAGGANAAIVRVDIETGHVEIERYVVVHDSGVLINPALVEGQIEGGVAHGIGNVLYEACTYSADGQFLSSTFADYALPQFDNVPPLEIRHTESASPFSPLGAKGTGESGTIGALPTVVSAIEDALSPWNIHFNRMPITPEMIAMEIEAVQEKNAS